MRKDNGHTDRESDLHTAAGGSCITGMERETPVKKMREKLRIDSCAVILYGEHRMSRDVHDVKNDAGNVPSVHDGIVQQIQKHLFNENRVHRDQ